MIRFQICLLYKQNELDHTVAKGEGHLCLAPKNNPCNLQDMLHCNNWIKRSIPFC